QTHKNWQVWASDDNSTDNTRRILCYYELDWPRGKLKVCSGPGKGFVANFFSLINNPHVKANFFAYSDQDDIWEQDKLERAVSWLKTVPENIPALYCSRTRLVDADNKEVGLSPDFHLPPSFANSLIQNIGGGNTMVFNGSALELLREAGEDTPAVIHDWWTYMIVAGCGGKVFYDSYPSL